MRRILSIYASILACIVAFGIQLIINLIFSLELLFQLGIAKKSAQLKHGGIIVDDQSHLDVFEVPMGGKGLLLGSLSAIALISLFWYTFHKRLNLTLPTINLSFKQSRIPFILLSLSILAQVWYDINASASSNDVISQTIRASLHTPILSFLGIALLIPLLEELMFRGVIWSSLEPVFSRVNTILITTVLFTLAHSAQYDIFGLIVIFYVGICLGWIRLTSKSFFASFIGHAVNNAVGFILLLLN